MNQIEATASNVRKKRYVIHASRVIGDWIRVYSNGRPYQSLGMRTPAEAFKLAA
ncbi:hypothetical protein GCM10011488_68610 [Steroidobacter agaridevorans]|nr:hypothetical protein GCM10011488_68610 [Steroidobacter agaridevorans]